MMSSSDHDALIKIVLLLSDRVNVKNCAKSIKNGRTTSPVSFTRRDEFTIGVILDLCCCD